ncbi:MAG: hypothetical protein IKI50_01495 [Clostridia bacterium]|nr:hypothetical protein [Clostridia bacterium]
MALQHFYARVPARVSLYNRADGFDTFACSEGITRDFSEKELSAVCNVALSPEDAELVRQGLLAPVYTQFLARSGELVQSCVTFLQKDYTGERSAYMVHSLIFNGEDRAALLNVPEGPVLDRSNYLHEMDGFDVTNPGARPVTDYPETAYKKEEPDVSEFPEGAAGDMLRRYLCAVLELLCGKVKNLFISLPLQQDRTDFMCTLFNATVRVLPYHLRSALSFASRVSSPAQVPAFRMRGLTMLPEQVKANKSIIISFEKKQMLGLSDEEVMQQLPIVDFLCSLRGNEALRREFLRFCQHVTDRMSDFAAPTFKALGDLVLLFRCGCDYCEDQNVIPNDDKLTDLILLYEKCRKALPDEFRIRIMRVLRRYPEEHREIPKKVFTKLSKMYPTEIHGTRRIILDVVLELIHTDLMRDKLLVFLGGIIEQEDVGSRADIIRHLCAVLYGGFLQPQILAIFARCYEGADEEVRTQILEKALLIIRTKAVQEQVINLIDEQYTDMTPAQKTMVLDTVFEQLGEGDALAAELIRLINTHAKVEDPAHCEELRTRILKEIEREQRRPAHPLLQMQHAVSGFFAETVADQMLQEWSGRRLFGEWLQIILGGPLNERTANLVYLCQKKSDADGKEQEKLLEQIREVFREHPPQATLAQLLDAVDQLGALYGPLPDAIGEKILFPIVRDALPNLFKDPARTLTVEQVIQRVEKKPLITGCSQYQMLQNYLYMKSEAQAGRPAAVIRYGDRFSADPALRTGLARYMKADLAGVTLPAQSGLAMALMLSFLQTGRAGLADAYAAFAQPAEQSADKKAAAKAAADAAHQAAELLILLCGSMVDDATLSEPLRQALLAEDSGLREMLSTYLATPGAKERLQAALNRLKPQNAFAQACRALIPQVMPKQSFLSSLLGKFKKG